MQLGQTVLLVMYPILHLNSVEDMIPQGYTTWVNGRQGSLFGIWDLHRWRECSLLHGSSTQLSGDPLSAWSILQVRCPLLCIIILLCSLLRKTAGGVHFASPTATNGRPKIHDVTWWLAITDRGRSAAFWAIVYAYRHLQACPATLVVWSVQFYAEVCSLPDSTLGASYDICQGSSPDICPHVWRGGRSQAQLISP